jgi:hypothetical protein
MNLLGLGTLVESVGKVADSLITTDKERLEMEIEQRKLDLEEKKLDQANNMAQIEVNKEEAKSASVFVSGWRPFIGWGCGFAFLYIGIVEPVARFVAKVQFGYTGEFPEIDPTITMQVLFGLLGLAGMRTYEKTQKVATK